MLKAEGLTLWRGATCLFEDLSFGAAPGTALLIRGPNGSGKTTLLRVIAGLTAAESGRVLWNDRPLERVLREPPVAIAYCGHATALKGDLTVLENLGFFARLFGYPRERLGGLLGDVGLGDCADLEVRYLSAGQRRRAAIARVLMSGAPLWLLDEPQTNLDTGGRAQVDALVAAHLRSGGTAVIAAHQPLDLGDSAVSELQLGTG